MLFKFYKRSSLGYFVFVVGMRGRGQVGVR